VSGFNNARIVVAGLGISGVAVARALVERGAFVTVADLAPAETHLQAIKDLNLEVLPDIEDLAGFDLVVTSPGWAPANPLLARAEGLGIEVIGDVELAWRLDQERSAIEGTPAPKWIAVTGTNGKTTAVGMLASILRAEGVRSVAAGNVGYSLVEAVLATPRFDVLAIELSSYQLHWSSTFSPHAGALINIAEDHLDWHGSLEAYAAAKVSLLHRSTIAIVNADDDLAQHFAASVADVIAVTRDIPRPGELGMVEEIMVDRAFCEPTEATELATTADVTPPAPHNITNALIAAALARTVDISPESVSAGLRTYRSDGHRIEEVATIEGVTYIDDSKATNPHAAQASIGAFDSVVWIAGGLAKGANMDDLVQSIAARLRGVVLIGADREIIAAALARHAPDVPLQRIDLPETEHVERDSAELMQSVVRAARQLARPGDTVLLAPACASMDQFTSYAHRGRLFAAAVGAEK
jgi:UDP-N-acetylmuramoylalanine--D-glutamate ligase